MQLGYLFILVFILNGCTTGMYQSMGVPVSKYQPVINSKEDRQKHYETLFSYHNQVIEDNLAKYYIKVYDKNILAQFILSHKFKNFLYVMREGVGLLEPAYSYDKKGNIIFDLELTKVIHEALKKINPNILGLEHTLNYRKYFEPFIYKQTVWSTFYDKWYYDNILKNFKHVDFIIINNGAFVSMSKIGSNNLDDIEFSDQISLKFMPSEYFKNSSKSGTYDYLTLNGIYIGEVNNKNKKYSKNIKNFSLELNSLTKKYLSDFYQNSMKNFNITVGVKNDDL